MLKRVIHEDWTTILPILSFWLLFLVFLVATIRSVIMRRSEAERMAALPLEDDSRRPSGAGRNDPDHRP